MRTRLSGKRHGSTATAVRQKNNRPRYGVRLCLEALELRETPAGGMMSFAPGADIIDMGQVTQTVANALKPYGLVYDLVTNYKTPVDWAINPAKTTYAFNSPLPRSISRRPSPPGPRATAAARSSSTPASSRPR
jgi:hypothetical protein